MKKIEELWKDIEGYKGMYQISNLGRVKSLARQTVGRGGMIVNLKERILKTHPSGINRRYLEAGLSKDGKKKKFFVHRLVASHFIGEIPNGKVINHIDENPTNNCVTNLEIISQGTNILKARQNNKASPHKKFKYILTDLQTGENLTFDTSVAAGQFLGIWDASIRRHADGTWSGIYKDKYKISRV